MKHLQYFLQQGKIKLLLKSYFKNDVYFSLCRMIWPLIDLRTSGGSLSWEYQWFGSSHLPGRKLAILTGLLMDPCSVAIVAAASP